MIADVGSHLAAKHPIGPARIHQDYRQEYERSNKQECLRPIGGSCLPKRKMGRYDQRVKADGNSEIGKSKEADAAGKCKDFGTAGERGSCKAASQFKRANGPVAVLKQHSFPLHRLGNYHAPTRQREVPLALQRDGADRRALARRAAR